MVRSTGLPVPVPVRSVVAWIWMVMGGPVAGCLNTCRGFETTTRKADLMGCQHISFPALIRPVDKSRNEFGRHEYPAL